MQFYVKRGIIKLVLFCCTFEKVDFRRCKPPNNYKEDFMMGKQILTTLVWTIIFFVLVATLNYLTGVNDWLMEALDGVIPAATGYFLGYDQARRNGDRQ